MSNRINKEIALLVMPLVISALCIVGVSLIKFKPRLSPDEQRLLVFPSFQTVQITERTSEGTSRTGTRYRKIFGDNSEAVSMLESPITVVTAKEEYPQSPLSKIAPPPEQIQKTGEGQEEMKLSFILINGGRKMAIINGVVVNEGDTVNQKKVAKIERKRVLIKDERGERWIRVE